MQPIRSKTLLLPLFCPPVSYFAAWAAAETVWLEQHETYQKGSYRNRCHIAGPNGLQRLSVPLEKGKHDGQPIREVRIAYHEPWIQQHRHSLQTAYGKSPFYEHYAPAIYRAWERRPRFLFDLNLALLEVLLPFLHLDASKMKRTPKYVPYPAPNAWDLRESIHPKKAPALDLPAYPQVFADRHGFLPDLSVLDLLFCLGPESGRVLTIQS